ncbi:MAG: maleylpyruvate isomerase family mycothiol-dependent enzyme [Acidimicrobiales bacterium]
MAPPPTVPASGAGAAAVSGAVIADELTETWGAIEALCSRCGPAGWQCATDCPGWTVQDVVAHLLGTESALLGRSVPETDGTPFPTYVHNAVGETNERWVRARRDLPGASVLEEFRAVAAERAEALRAMTEEELAAHSWTPAGPGTYADLMMIRVFDSWVHEQDIRRALGHPGHLAGPPAERSLDQVQRASPYIVAKKAGAPDGSHVVFEVRGPTERRWGVVVVGARGQPATATIDADVRVLAEFETFMAVACGRWAPGPAMADGRIAVEGRLALGRAVVDQLDFVI